MIYFKQAFTSGGMDLIVVCKSSKGEPFCPISLEIVDEDMEIFLNFLIDSFSLSIFLKVKGVVVYIGWDID